MDFNGHHYYGKPGSFTITLTAKSLISGCTASASKTININKSPIAAFSIPDNGRCQPLQITFQNQTSGGDYYYWNFNNGNTSTDINGQQLFKEPGTYTISLKAMNTMACTDSISKKLIVNPKPVSAFNSSSIQTCVTPVDVAFTNLSEAAEDYKWDFGNGSISKETNPEITFNAAGDYNVSLIASNIFLCSDTSRIIYHAYHNPVADFRVDTTIGCDPFKVKFINLSKWALQYFWNIDGQGTSEDQEPEYTLKGEGFYSVSLKVVGQGGCNDSIAKRDFIMVHPSPVSNFKYLKINGLDTVQFYNNSTGAISYLWNYGDGQSSSEENPLHRYTNYGSYIVSLTSTNQFNCINVFKDSIEFVLFKGLFMPNALSPGNASAEVREFKAVGTGLIKYHLVIYDTWGNLIWETTKLDKGSPSEGWDGTFKGKALPPDVYVWHIKEAIFKDGRAYEGQRYGSITLIK